MSKKNSFSWVTFSFGLLISGALVLAAYFVLNSSAELPTALRNVLAVTDGLVALAYLATSHRAASAQPKSRRSSLQNRSGYRYYFQRPSKWAAFAWLLILLSLFFANVFALAGGEESTSLLVWTLGFIVVFDLLLVLIFTAGAMSFVAVREDGQIQLRSFSLLPAKRFAADDVARVECYWEAVVAREGKPAETIPAMRKFMREYVKGLKFKSLKDLTSPRQKEAKSAKGSLLKFWVGTLELMNESGETLATLRMNLEDKEEQKFLSYLPSSVKVTSEKGKVNIADMYDAATFN